MKRCECKTIEFIDGCSQNMLAEVAKLIVLFCNEIISFVVAFENTKVDDISPQFIPDWIFIFENILAYISKVLH